MTTAVNKSDNYDVSYEVCNVFGEPNMNSLFGNCDGTRFSNLSRFFFERENTNFPEFCKFSRKAEKVRKIWRNRRKLWNSSKIEESVENYTIILQGFPIFQD